MAQLVRARRDGIASRRRQWQELSDRQRAIFVIAGLIEVFLMAIAAVDLYRRPADGVRGRKGLWWPTIFVQPIGPLAYLVFGPRRSDQE